jgi:type IV pilus assembly protein PilC
MLTFQYTAVDNKTKEVIKADVKADSISSASKLLSEQGLFPISIVDKQNLSFFEKLLKQRIKTKDRIVFSRQLSTLINAGLPLTQSLRTVKDQIENKTFKEVIDGVVSSVEAGKSLSIAFSEYPKVFSHIYLSLIQAGEASGTLDKTLESLADQEEKDAAITSKIRSALIYPAVILVVILLVLVFMISSVLPQVADFYKQQNKQLPFATLLLSNISNFLTSYWWLTLIIAAGSIYALVRFLKTSLGISIMDTIKLRVPGFGIIFQKIYMTRFARTLGAMMGSGIPMIQGLEIVRDGIGNVHVAETINQSIEKVKGGKSLSSTLEGKDTFLSLVPQMLLIGEKSGAMDQMLNRVAGYYEAEVDEAIKNISTLIEPALMVVMGVLIGGVILTILYPIYSLVGGGVS